MIKVMRNAQKIIRRDPDLMTVMQININDSDITNTPENRKADEEKKKEKETEKPKAPGKPPAANDPKKKGFSNLFG